MQKDTEDMLQAARDSIIHEDKAASVYNIKEMYRTIHSTETALRNLEKALKEPDEYGLSGFVRDRSKDSRIQSSVLGYTASLKTKRKELEDYLVSLDNIKYPWDIEETA